MAQQEKEPAALQHFLSLRSAAALAYTAATRQHTSSVDILNKVARIIAAVTPVFVRTPHNGPARVLPLELAEGELEGGGEDLRFKDGRPPVGGLLILHKNLGDVIEHVRAAYRQGKAGTSGQR
jgi:hypothetical protein